MICRSQEETPERTASSMRPQRRISSEENGTYDCVAAVSEVLILPGWINLRFCGGGEGPVTALQRHMHQVINGAGRPAQR